MWVEFEVGNLLIKQQVSSQKERLEERLEHEVKRETQWLKNHPFAPHPYDAHVRYQLEEFETPGKRRERWQRIKTTLRKRTGDCEDLAIYLAAWIRARMGIKARVALIEFTNGVKSWYHAVVELPTGRIFDPSKQLGM